MRQVSPSELIELGRKFGIEVDDAEVDAIQDQVNEMLSPLDGIDDLPTGGHHGNVGARTWQEPDDDPYNAVATVCHVPPSEAGTDVLQGMTVGLKDILAVAGVPMECGSTVMQGYVPQTDATVVDRLRTAGATIVAKTSLDEFAGSARGTTGVDSPVRNPHEAKHTAGGSSGGSAAAVAAGRTDVALGTDTGGSIRIPAAFCGVVGYKPTYGLVPLSGVVENTYTQDHVGPLSSSVADAASVLEAIAGKDSADPASMAAAGRDDYRVGNFVEATADAPRIEDLSIGVLEEGLGEGVTTAMAEQTQATIGELADAGASVKDVSVENFRYGLEIKNIMSFTELAAHWRDGGATFRRGGLVDEGYQTALARRAATSSGELSEFYRSKLLAGAQLMEAHQGRHYMRAQKAREVLFEEFGAVLDDVDVIAMPTVPDVAPRLEDVADPGFGYARNTRAANVTRLPAVTLPNGSIDGLPTGLQLMGPAFEDDRLLAAATAVERQIES